MMVLTGMPIKYYLEQANKKNLNMPAQITISPNQLSGFMRNKRKIIELLKTGEIDDKTRYDNIDAALESAEGSIRASEYENIHESKIDMYLNRSSLQRPRSTINSTQPFVRRRTLSRPQRSWIS